MLRIRGTLMRMLVRLDRIIPFTPSPQIFHDGVISVAAEAIEEALESKPPAMLTK